MSVGPTNVFGKLDLMSPGILKNPSPPVPCSCIQRGSALWLLGELAHRKDLRSFCLLLPQLNNWNPQWGGCLSPMLCLLPPDLPAIRSLAPRSSQQQARASEPQPDRDQPGWDSEYHDLNGESQTVDNEEEMSWDLNLAKRSYPDYRHCKLD